MNQRKLAITITFTGTIPFLLSALLIWMDIRPLFLPGSLKLIAHSYAVLVASFICGMQWGVHLRKLTRDSLYLISAAIALAMWSTLLMAGSNPGLLIAATALLILLGLDFRLFSREEIPSWFFGLRTLATLIAVVCLLFMVVF